MKKILILSAIATLAIADITNQTSNQKSESKTDRQSEQKSIQQSDSQTLQKSRGDENSQTQTLTKNLSEIKSVTQSATRSKNGTWSIKINPIPYLLMQLRAMGWDRRAFALRNSDVGSSFYVNEDEDIIDLNAKAFAEAKASTRGNLSADQTSKLKNTIELLNYTGAIADKAAEYMRGYYAADVSNVEELAKVAISKAYKEIEKKSIDIYSCNYGGNNDIYNCNDSEYTVMLTNSVPTLLKNGVPFYSAEKIGFSTPSLDISFATSDSEAMSKLMQDSNSKSVAQAVREYTSHLEQSGQTEVAQKIKTAMLEKALTSNLSNSASATIQAINSGSPTQVLRVFQ